MEQDNAIFRKGVTYFVFLMMASLLQSSPTPTGAVLWSNGH